MSGSAVLQSPPSDVRRDAIVRYARQQFLSVGYAATRIEPIAREASVSTATLYAYFPGKTQLFAAVIADTAEDFSQRMSKVRTASGSAREQLLLFTKTYAEFMSDPFVRSVFSLVMAERPRFKAIANRFLEKGRQDFGGALISALDALRESGQLKFEKSSWAAGQLMGMVEHPVFFVPLMAGEDLPARRSCTQIATDAVETFMARYGV